MEQPLAQQRRAHIAQSHDGNHDAGIPAPFEKNQRAKKLHHHQHHAGGQLRRLHQCLQNRDARSGQRAEPIHAHFQENATQRKAGDGNCKHQHGLRQRFHEVLIFPIPNTKHHRFRCVIDAGELLPRHLMELNEIGMIFSAALRNISARQMNQPSSDRPRRRQIAPPLVQATEKFNPFARAAHEHGLVLEHLLDDA